MTPETFDAGMVLCAAPQDPCTHLHIVVSGSVAVIRADGVVERVRRGGTFGESAFLPHAAHGSAEQFVRSGMSVVCKVCVLRSSPSPSPNPLTLTPNPN